MAAELPESDALHDALQVMAEQLLGLRADVDALHQQLRQSNQCVGHLVARIDQLEALQAQQTVLAAHETRADTTVLKPASSPPAIPRGSAVRRFGLVFGAGVLVAAGLVVASRNVGFGSLPMRIPQTIHAPWSRPKPPVLTLTVRQSSWLEVMAKGGKVLYYGMAKPGRYVFPVSTCLNVLAGRPDLVLMDFRGVSEPLGSIDRTDWRRIGCER